MYSRFALSLVMAAMAWLFFAGNSSAAIVHIGDDAPAGELVTAGSSGPDSANGGEVTYAFPSNPFQNSSGGVLDVEVREVNFWANSPGVLTPFVASFAGGDPAAGANYTVLAVGDAIDGVTGRNNASFTVDGSAAVITLEEGEELVAGFHQSVGMVPWDAGTGDYLTEGNVIPAVGEAFASDSSWSGLGRGYKFNVGVEVASNPLPPTDIELSNTQLLPGVPVGTEVGVLNALDPNASDNVFTYELVSGQGDADNERFAIAGPRLETAAALGPAGSSYEVRLRATDPGGLFVEKTFVISIVAGQPPSALSLTANVIAFDAPSGATVGVFETNDPDAADVHTYALVAGAGDGDNARFLISDDRLRTAGDVPPDGSTLSIRVRSTDLGGFAIEETFTILVIKPSVRISEFMASNSSTMRDEDGETSDWIEILNEQTEEVNLAGWYLTDNVNDLTKWEFPSRVVPGGGHLVIFASGKDRAETSDARLHTNFQLASSGEFLALVEPDGQTLASVFAPEYPPQTSDVSYGVSQDGSVTGFFFPPTPREANGEPAPAGINTVEFSPGRGFYDDPVEVTLTPTIPGSVIRYTTDGSKPTPRNGTIYSGPITVGRTGMVRAISFSEQGDGPESVVATHTYLFVDDVRRQSAMWSGVTEDPAWGPRLENALLDLPTVSLVTEGAISPSERETSMELVFPDGTTGFQVDCGVEHFGGHSLNNSPKKNMRLSFKKLYGPSRLNYDLFGGGAATEFDQILLRTGSHDTWFWTHPSGHGGIYIRNRWAFDRQLEAGHVAPRGRWVHVYLNGLYHGMHHLMERPNAAFMASYLGGEKEDYEALNAGSPIDGDKSTWNAMKATLGNYVRLQNYMDVENYADYMLLQFYCGNDWDWNTSQNWAAASRKAPDAAYKFFAWDSDVILRSTLQANVINRGGPESMWSAIRQHDEFRLLLADRAQKFFFNDGMLTRERVLTQFDELAARIERGIIAETARWGNFSNYTPAIWQRELDEVKRDLIGRRTRVVVDQLRAEGLFPDFDAPLFSQFGGEVPAGYRLSLSLPDNAGGGEIFYTLDGSDPLGDAVPGDSIETILFDQGAAARALIPGADNGGDMLGDSWKGGAEPFDDSDWLPGETGIGFDAGNDFDPLIGLDLIAMQSVNASAFARIPFSLTQAQIDGIDDLRLDMKTEDGFVAYLNGVEVASLHKPSPLSWDSNATDATSDSVATRFQPHDITDHRGVLVPGLNMLSLHLLNQSKASSDLLCLPRLVAVDVPAGQGGDPGGQLYDGPITLTESGTVRARVKRAGEWSALEEAFFYVDAVAPTPGDLVISEIHYNPSGADDTEFLELLNISAMNLVLDGVRFADGIRFTMPAQTVLAPGQHAVVVADEASFASRYLDSSSPWFSAPVTVLGEYTGSLSNGGENLILQSAVGEDLLEFPYNDSGKWPGRADGKGSSAELADTGELPTSQPDLNNALADGEAWRPSSEFHGSPGRDGFGPDNRVVINELLARSNPPAVDWFELYNTTDESLALGGWFVSDDSDDYRKFELPAPTLIGARMFLTYDEADFNSGASHVDFALNGTRGDDLYLVEADSFGNLLRFVDRVEFGAARAGESLGRWPDESGDLYPLRTPTPGRLNSDAGNSVQVGSVVVSEIMYNPEAAPEDGLEFIEIYNSGELPEELANWRLRGEADFDFASELLAAGAVRVVVGFDPGSDTASRERFLAAYPGVLAAQLRGPWSAGFANRLDNGGATVRLERPDALESPAGEAPFYPMLLEDVVRYNDTPPWPTAANGGGASLNRISPLVYGDDPGNWRAASASPGVHVDLAVRYDAWAVRNDLGNGPEADRFADFDLDGVINYLEYALDLDPRRADARLLPSPGMVTLDTGGQTERYLTLTFRRRRDAPHLTYDVQVSGDLLDWETTRLQVGGPIDNGDGTDSLIFRDEIPVAPGTPRFIRLLVTE